MNSNSSIISDSIVDIDAKSEGEHLDKQVLLRHLSDGQHNYHNIYRRYSLPEQSEDSNRRIITQHVIVRVIELGLNINMAEVILNSLDAEEFTESSENRILNKVIQALLLADQINEIQDRQERKSIYRQLKQIIGKTNPNLMGYLGYVDQSASLSQSMLQRLCSICYDSYDESSMVEIQGCQHSFCLDCYKAYLTQRIMNGYADKMTCPAGGCIERISDQYIKDLLGEDMFNKMNKFRKIKRLAHETDITWCPRQGCEEFVQKKSNGKMVVCRCGQEICTSCGRAYHDDISCNNQLENDFNKAIRKFKIQKCAKCKSPIQKNDGCNHMTCYHCEYEFCWLCRSKSSSRHYDPYNIFGCPGMQFSHRDPFRFPNFYRFLVIIAIILFGPPAAVIALIFGFIAVVIGLPAIGYMTWVSHSHFEGYSKCRKALVIMGLTVACIALSPLSLILVCLAIVALILFSIPYSIYMIIQYI